MEEERKIKKSVKIRLNKEAQEKSLQIDKGQLGSVKSHLRDAPTSPRKMRLVVDMIRGQEVNNALNILRYDVHAASRNVEKLLLTAIANWQAANEEVKIEEAKLYISEAFVDGGHMLKRMRPAPQGRGHRIRKRSNHITIVVANANNELKNLPTETKDAT